MCFVHICMHMCVYVCKYACKFTNNSAHLYVHFRKWFAPQTIFIWFSFPSFIFNFFISIYFVLIFFQTFFVFFSIFDMPIFVCACNIYLFNLLFTPTDAYCGWEKITIQYNWQKTTTITTRILFFTWLP